MNKKLNLILLASALLIIILALQAGLPKESEPAKVTSTCNPLDLSGELDLKEAVGFFEKQIFNIPKIALQRDSFSVLSAGSSERWIEIDLSEQKLRAWEGDELFLETLVSTGLPWMATPEGEYRIWIKLRATKMEGGSGKYYYYLPNVPYVMYFENDQVPGWRGYGLHGTYWHDDFGTQRSHGCVNLPTPIARELYYWVNPNFSSSQYTARSSVSNPGTKIVIHQ